MSAAATLRRLLHALGDPLIDVPAAPHGLDVAIGNVVIVDSADLTSPCGTTTDPGPAEDTVEISSGDLVLVIGARGRDAAQIIEVLGARGAGAVAVKATGVDEHAALRRAAQEARVAVLAVRPQVRWDQLEALCRGVVGEAAAAAEGAETGAGGGATDLNAASGDLFSLAQTVAALTGGLVSIEDSSSRVLAYSGSGSGSGFGSGSDEEVDELRRLSVLGRQGPEHYLSLLREWGVFQRLRSSDDVVLVDEHPELGLRRRLAVRVHAGAHTLGTIWVQEGQHPFTERAQEALRGAARVVALQLLRQRTEASAGSRLREDVLSGLLEGRVEPEVAGGMLQLSNTRAVTVAVLEIHSQAGPAEDIAQRSSRELSRTQLTNLVRMHASAYRRTDLVTRVGSRVYVLLEQGRGGPDSVVEWTRTVAAEARTLLGLAVHGAVGATAPSMDTVAESRSEADRVLAVLADRAEAEVATIADVRSQLLVQAVLAQLRADPSARDPRVTALVAHDSQNGAALARSVLAYLTAFGDVRQAAGHLHVHPNTLRYRLRQAQAVSGLDLSEADQRLFAHLQLLIQQRG